MVFEYHGQWRTSVYAPGVLMVPIAFLSTHLGFPWAFAPMPTQPGPVSPGTLPQLLYVRNLPELCYTLLDAITMSEICQDYARNYVGTCLSYARTILELCRKYARTLLELRQKCVRHILELRKTNARTTSGICQKRARTTSDMYQKCSRTTPELN